jgi:ABC-type polysaccharide/polyol phosphate export permease
MKVCRAAESATVRPGWTVDAKPFRAQSLDMRSGGDGTLAVALLPRRGMAGRGYGVLSELREVVGEQFAYRELMFRMTQRDLLLRYKQTFMGVAWAVLMPVVNTAIFSIVFTRVAPIDTGVPYPLYAYTGLLAWNFFASSMRFAATSLTSNSTLVTKIYFPREVLPLSSVLVTLVDTAIGFGVLVLMMAYYRVAVTPAILLLPVVFAVEFVFTSAAALLLSMANLFYRDIKYLLEFGLVIWMFATSVVYPIDRIDGRLGSLLRLNPMVPIVDAFRAAVVGSRMPDASAFAIVALVSVVGLCAAWIGFHRAEVQFAENI